ncbi:MAG: hypothetical protein MK005_06105 [Alcanivorax sp.]|nr:hypothetical protein [Alcanivorax sp.]
MWPRRLELSASRYPARLRLAAVLTAWWALAASALPLSVAVLPGLAVLIAARRWRPASPARVAVSPEGLRLLLRDGRRVAVAAPFRTVLRARWLAVHCPRVGWVWVFPDQVGAAAVTPLRQVLLLGRRP